MDKKKNRVVFLVSHVIQYQGPLFKKIAAHPEIDFTVLFYSRHGLEKYKDREFGVDVKWDRDLLAGYKHKFLGNYSPIKSYESFFSYFNPGLFGELTRGHYDAVIIYGYARLMSWLAWLTCSALRIPVIFLGETNLLQHSRRQGVVRSIKEGLLKMFFSGCAAVFYLGKLNRDYYKYLGVPDAKLFHWPYTVDNDFFMEAARKYKPAATEIKSAYHLPQDKVLVLFSGKLISKKCPLDLVKAFELMENRNKAALVFAGDGPLRSEIETYARDKNMNDTHVLGFLNQTDLTKVYAAAGIFVFPSDFEPWGLSLNEAMCYGLPAVVSDSISAGYDLVRDGENGFVYKTNDIPRLKDKLDTLTADKELRARMGRRSSEIIDAWNYDKVVQGVIQAMQKVMRDRE